MPKTKTTKRYCAHYATELLPPAACQAFACRLCGLRCRDPEHATCRNCEYAFPSGLLSDASRLKAIMVHGKYVHRSLNLLRHDAPAASKYHVARAMAICEGFMAIANGELPSPDSTRYCKDATPRRLS